MKNLLFAILILSANVLYANKAPWLFVCGSTDLQFANDKRYFFLSESDSNPLILGDSKNIQINRKNKTIKVWVTDLISYSKRQGIISKLGKYDDFSNLGYDNQLLLIDYANMRYKIISFSYFNCDGTVISTTKGDGVWDEIPPSTTMDGVTQSIMNKYKIKGL